MSEKIIAALLIAACALSTGAEARIKRSQSAKVEFKAENPCPATGARKGPCNGYVIDHRMPLCAGGIDSPKNMAWSKIDEAKKKDLEEIRLCGAIRQGRMAYGDSQAICQGSAPSKWPLLSESLCVDGRNAN